MPPWLLSVLIGLLIVIIIVIWFQFVYIRVKLAKYEDLDKHMNDSIRDTAASNIDTTSNVRIYSLIVDFNITKELNTANDLNTRLKELYPKHTRTLHYDCDVVRPVRVSFPDMYFVAIKADTKGAYNLTNDLLNNKINYLAFKEKVYLVMYKHDFKDNILIPLLKEASMFDSFEKMGINDVTFITLYDITSHKAIDQIDTSCKFEMTSFFDRVSTTNLNTYSSYTNFSQKVLSSGVVHVMGYNTL